MHREVVTLVSDLSGGEPAETVSFSLDGTGYEIDLTNAEARTLRLAMEEFALVAKRTGGPKRYPLRSTVAPAPSTKQERDAIRSWAHAHGYEFSDRSKIPAEVIEAYHAAR
ncbi:MAG: Lsr2 family protein [Nocardioides sp.]|uniref:histone-like nucleoid-structuring protein Lsr2 n=1 Tax=Nocardioides sp. TaxID=35761 RepID=UPI0039E24090